MISKQAENELSIFLSVVAVRTITTQRHLNEYSYICTTTQKIQKILLPITIIFYFYDGLCLFG